MKKGFGKGKKSIGTILLLIVVALVKWKFPHLFDQGGKQEVSVGNYEVYSNCRLIDRRNNDGDSFHAMVNGKQEELRLYFVDCPESAIKKYRDGNSNIKRIRQQGEYFGGLEPEQTTQIGQDAKVFTKALLKKGFDVFTKREFVFEPPRIHAFIQVKHGGKKRFLHELLVEEGLGRIYTKPADLPDGTSASRQKVKLKSLEKAARSAGKGAWKA